jgi:hypothetical protein
LAAKPGYQRAKSSRKLEQLLRSFRFKLRSFHSGQRQRVLRPATSLCTAVSKPAAFAESHINARVAALLDKLRVESLRGSPPQGQQRQGAGRDEKWRGRAQDFGLRTHLAAPCQINQSINQYVLRRGSKAALFGQHW